MASSVSTYKKKGPVSSARTPATAWTTGPCRPRLGSAHSFYLQP